MEAGFRHCRGYGAHHFPIGRCMIDSIPHAAKMV
jgi:hypothetical protein